MTHEAHPAIDATTLFRSHATVVARVLTSVGVGRSDVEDLVQETFMVAHRKGGFVPSSGEPCAARPTTWLIGIALGLLSNHRKRRRRFALALESHTEAVSGLAEGRQLDQLEALESLKRLQHALDGLGAGEREAFVLCEVGQCSCEEAAAILNVSLGTLYSRLHRARKAVQRFYWDLEGTSSQTKKSAPLNHDAVRKVGT